MIKLHISLSLILLIIKIISVLFAKVLRYTHLRFLTTTSTIEVKKSLICDAHGNKKIVSELSLSEQDTLWKDALL